MTGPFFEVQPYPFIRVVTLTLAAFWTLRAAVRMVRFLDRWERRFAAMGLSRGWLRRQALRFLARATILDLVNLLLLIALIGLWSL